MPIDPNDELGRERLARRRARRAFGDGMTGDRSAITDQEAAIARARESVAFSRPGPDDDEGTDLALTPPE